MAEPDDLYTLRQEFYVGNFQVRRKEGREGGREGMGCRMGLTFLASLLPHGASILLLRSYHVVSEALLSVPLHAFCPLPCYHLD